MHLLMWLFAIPPHLEYVATLPCNLSLIASFLTLMFHKVHVVWQHMQGVWDPLLSLCCKFTAESSGERILKIC